MEGREMEETAGEHQTEGDDMQAPDLVDTVDDQVIATEMSLPDKNVLTIENDKITDLSKEEPVSEHDKANTLQEPSVGEDKSLDIANVQSPSEAQEERADTSEPSSEEVTGTNEGNVTREEHNDPQVASPEEKQGAEQEEEEDPLKETDAGGEEKSEDAEGEENSKDAEGEETSEAPLLEGRPDDAVEDDGEKKDKDSMEEEEETRKGMTSVEEQKVDEQQDREDMGETSGTKPNEKEAIDKDTAEKESTSMGGTEESPEATEPERENEEKDKLMMGKEQEEGETTEGMTPVEEQQDREESTETTEATKEHSDKVSGEMEGAVETPAADIEGLAEEDRGAQRDGGESKGQDEEEEEEKIPESFFYDYETICSKPFVTPDSGIPDRVLQLLHSFGYDCTKRANLHLLDDQTLLYVAGTNCVILKVKTQEQIYLRSSSGAGIGAVTVHPTRNYFAVAEKGNKPDIIIYEYPSLRPYRILKGGTEEAYAFADFNVSGTLLASMGSSPDYMLTIWDWRQEKIMLRSKAFSQDVFQVTFSTENEAQLTSCGSGHIKFWKMARTFTGLKLQGALGRFGKTALTDIEGYVELPDGKVISGSEWGNMLLWEGGLIKVELCRKGRKTCHNGTINHFVLDEGEIITLGSDGYVRVWDFETVDTADTVDDTGLLEMEPMNELLVGKNVNLRYMVKMMEPDFPMWYAQDANGAIWKLDLSFSNITQDPECLFSFHSGKIKALDVSPSSYLMATTSLDRSVRIYDFSGKYPLVEMKFKQGGTSLAWAPRMVNPKGGLFAAGFEDGVVRILEVYNPQRLRLVAGRTSAQLAEISLKQAFKPHTAPVTALAYERNGEILATGSKDNTVFFFAVGDNYEPIGFVGVPGPVKELHWSPPTHEENVLLVICENGCVVQVSAPAAQKRDPESTFEIPDLRLQYFRFSSIKSKMEREEEIACRQKVREQKQKEHAVWAKKQKEQGIELTEEELMDKSAEEEEELPPLYIPETPSPILCGFYATPGKFWLSLDGYDSGFLYLCEFSDNSDQSDDPSTRRDEPLSALPIKNTTDNPIDKMHFSSNKQLLFCGMKDGAVRVYPLQASDPLLTSLHGYWSLGVHDNQYGEIQAISSSYDNQYLVTCGADGNIFTFSILSMEDIERDLKVVKAKVPSPRIDLEDEKPAEDIDDPNTYSIETAKKKLQHDLLMKQAEQKKAKKKWELEQLRNEFRLLLIKNQDLPNHMQLGRAEFEMDHRIREEMERQTSERIRTVLKELAWEKEKHNIALNKLQERYRGSIEFDTVTLHAINSGHQVSTYRLLSLAEKYYRLMIKFAKRRPTRYELRLQGDDRDERWGADSSGSSSRDEKDLDAIMPTLRRKQPKSKGGWREERMRKIIEKAEKAKSKIAKRKQEWEELYNMKPSDDYEDPDDVQAIQYAKDNMGDYQLKTSEQYTIPEHLRINAEKKRNELARLEGMIHEQKTTMNEWILSLRDFKVDIIAEIQQLVQELKVIQSMLDPSKRLPIPPVPIIHPDEKPEEKFEYNSETLNKFKKEQGSKLKESEAMAGRGFGGFEGFGARQNDAVKQVETHSRPSTNPMSAQSRASSVGCITQVMEADQSEMEKEVLKIEEIKNLYMQEDIIRKINEITTTFDAELRFLRHNKLKLDLQMKMGDLKHITLFEELLLLKDFEKLEDTLQEKVSDRLSEKKEIKRKTEDCLQQLETKKKEIAKLQEREKALTAAFHASLGENNKFATFLTKVFKKKIKRAKKKEADGTKEEEEESDEESDDESAWESDADESGSEDGVFDDSVCPPNCDPALFNNTLQLREKRLDIEEALNEEKKIMDTVKKDYDTLTKKFKFVEHNLKQAVTELDSFQREKQKKLNELHVVVPLKLHQVDYIVNGEIPSDISQALVFTNHSLEGLHHRIRELQLEKQEKRALYKQAREQHKQLIRDKKEMENQIHMLEEQCREQMIMRFGRIVDLEAMQTLSVNKTLEELKMKSAERGHEMDKESEEWETKVMDMKKNLMEVTKEHTRKLEKMNQLMTEKKVLEAKLNARQTTVGAEFHGPRKSDRRERQKLRELVEMQVEEIENLKEEISLLSKKGGSILPPAHPPMPHNSGAVA